MKEWCMEHPFMTFFLVYAALQAINNIGQALFNAIGRIKK